MRALVQIVARGLDDRARAAGISRAAAGRRAGIDTSTLWRAVHRGETRDQTLASFAEAVAGMAARTTVAHQGLARHVAAVCEWIGDRREDAAIPDLALSELRNAKHEQRQQPGKPAVMLRLFVDLAIQRASGIALTGHEQVLLAVLGLTLLEEGVL